MSTGGKAGRAARWAGFVGGWGPYSLLSIPFWLQPTWLLLEDRCGQPPREVHPYPQSISGRDRRPGRLCCAAVCEGLPCVHVPLSTWYSASPTAPHHSESCCQPILPCPGLHCSSLSTQPFPRCGAKEPAGLRSSCQCPRARNPFTSNPA